MQIIEFSTEEVEWLAQHYVGLKGSVECAPDPVEAGAVRRYAQAIGDEKPKYGPDASPLVAPPLFPTWMFRRPLGTPDPISLNADNPDFDGVGAPAALGLPPIVELAEFAALNGGVEVEFFRYAVLGEYVTVQSTYQSIERKSGNKGAMILVVIRSEYRTIDGELLLRVDRTGIRRKFTTGAPS